MNNDTYSQNEWDITAFIKLLVDNGVEVKLDLVLGKNTMSFELFFRNRNSDLVFIAAAAEEYFKGFLMGA